ncbi:MAG: hypothetical protein VW378_01055 [bacterium]
MLPKEYSIKLFFYSGVFFLGYISKHILHTYVLRTKKPVKTPKKSIHLKRVDSFVNSQSIDPKALLSFPFDNYESQSFAPPISDDSLMYKTMLSSNFFARNFLNFN